MSREFAGEEVDWVWEVVWATRHTRHDGDEERVRGGVEQAGSSSSTNETERKWQDQVDGLSAKRRKGTKKAVHFEGASGVPEAGEDRDKPGEKAVATL